MLNWLLAAIVLYYLQILMPATMRFLQVGTQRYVGSRDDLPALTGIAGRLERAAKNMQENMVAFVALALALMFVGLGADAQALTGAAIFVVARAFYVPLYAFAVPWVRSIAWVVGWAGLIWMALPLIGAA